MSRPRYINAILTKDSPYWLCRANGATEKHVSFNNKQIRLLGKEKDGIQRFQTGLGHTCFTQSCFITYPEL